MFRPIAVIALTAFGVAASLPAASFADDNASYILTINHFVPHQSTAPPIAGQPVQLYLRERVQAQTLTHTDDFGGDVVLFVHGAWLNSTGEFDAPYQDYSWMAYLAADGFDTFALDLTGYGYSTRPAALDNPCNVAAEQRQLVVLSALPQICSPSLATQVNTAQSEWDDLDAAVDYVRYLRHVDRVSLVGYSLGGTRAAGYAALHPEKVGRLALLAPTYDGEHPTMALPVEPDASTPVTLIGRGGVVSNWDRQVQCANQFDPAFRDVMWAEGLRADGVVWAPDQRRVPTAPSWLWNRSIATNVQAPTLVISGELDQMTPFTVPALMRAAYADLGTTEKVFLDIPCASHFAMWEAPHLRLFGASREWLRDGSVHGEHAGEVRLEAAAN
jgi:pimeloyl-ACP methyl ester carboxylesterase